MPNSNREYSILDLEEIQIKQSLNKADILKNNPQFNFDSQNQSWKYKNDSRSFELKFKEKQLTTLNILFENTQLMELYINAHVHDLEHPSSYDLDKAMYSIRFIK